MSKKIIRTVFYSGLVLSLRTFFQKLPKWVQFAFVIASGVILSSVISLKIYGFILSDIDPSGSVYLKIYNAVISVGLFLLLASFFSYALFLIFVKRWIFTGGSKEKGGLFSFFRKGDKGKDSGKPLTPKNLSNAPLEEVLEIANDDQLIALASILGCNPEKKEIQKRLCYLGQSTSKYITQRLLRKNQTPDQIYKGLVRNTAQKLKVHYFPYETTSAIEIRISQKVIMTVWAKLNKEQKKELEETLRREAEKYEKTTLLVTSGSLYATLTAAHLSGLGVYLLTSTALSALNVGVVAGITSALGGVIGLIAGPVGWLGAGLFAIWHLDKPNYQKIVPAVIYISSLRTGYK